MAGKSSKSKSKAKSGGTSHKHASASNSEVSTAACSTDHNVMDTSQISGNLKLDATSTGIVETEGIQVEKQNAFTREVPVGVVTVANGQSAELTDADAQVDGELRLYPMAVKGPAGEHVELQVSPGDSVMDLRQFLLDAPETSFYTCYDLILSGADGSKHKLADFYEIGDVADVTTGHCTLEMVNALYDDRSVRSHLRRMRDLLSTTNIHSSLSTTLAMEYEAKKQMAAGAGKQETPELEGLGFMEDPTGHLENLILSPAEQEITCLGSIAFSSFNPAPGYRRLVGDLVYLDVVTLEGKNYCVTAHTRGFFVNSSSGNILGPAPISPVLEGTTLAGLLCQLSDKFAKGLKEILERKSQCHPFENVPTLLPLNPWLGISPPPAHKRDISRAEDALLLPYGTEIVGMQRDWNEELQSCREFPRKSLQDRIMRDRALYKVNSDFVDAATKGAKGVIGRCIPPINPTDPERFHMYVHNNIFFSFAIDGDFTLMQQMHQKESKEQEHVSDDAEKKGDKLDQKVHEESKTAEQCSRIEPASQEKPVVKTVGDISDVRVVQSQEKMDSSVSTQIESEQATYASANNDLKGTKAYNNADVTALYTLAMAIVDYRGHRIIAQSIIPGILQGDKSESLLYGSVDNGKKISWNERFHLKVVDAGKLLHIKEHEVYDESGNKVKMAAPVECKGILGSDDRHYLLDLMRTTPRDANYTGPGTRHCVLRPELVSTFCQVEALERLKDKETEVDGIDEKSLPQEGPPLILLNSNVFTDFKLAGSPEDIAADEELVKKAAKYLVDEVLPKFMHDLSSLEVSPMDGQTLTEALHAHGINIRYLGKVASMAKHLPHIWDLCIVEMVVRAAKHVLKGILRETLDHDVAGAMAHFFNCLFDHDPPKETISTKFIEGQDESNSKGTGKAERGRKKGKGGEQKKTVSTIDDCETNEQNQLRRFSSKDEEKLVHRTNIPTEQPYMCITSELVWTDIREIVKFKYQFELPDDVKLRVQKISTIRNLCLKVGVTLASRRYDFSSVTPFQISDILDLHAVVKHSVPLCADARDLLESGKLRLAQGKLNEAYELFSEAFTILQQICGPMHREVANCCRYLAMVLYHAGDMAGAIMQQHKELIINERCLGLDHPDTAHSYGNMALFYHGLNQTELALRHMSRTLFLLNVSSGSDHPDVAATFINIAMMYQDVGRMHIALRYLQEALQKNLRLLGVDHIQTAVCYHALAIAFNCMGAYKLSLQHERSTYNILTKQLGEDDARTRDSANWLKTFQIRDMQAQKHKGQQSVTVAAAQKAAEALKARPDLLQAFQVAAGGGIGRGSLSKAAATAALMGETLPRSRGIDERGARAAAEVRKKAVARGLSIRSQGVPIQALPPLTELISLINNDLSGKAPVSPIHSTSSSCLDGGSDVLGDTGNICTTTIQDEESGQAKENGLPLEKGLEEKSTDQRAPLGLGVGLGPLDAKKTKQKTKTVT